MKHFVILLNGEAPEHLPRPGADLLVAADGGYHHARRWGWEPDVVVGDFDSLAEEPPPEVQRHHLPDQDRTDFQKALALLPVAAEARLDVYGALGGRSDHQLTNLQLASSLPKAWKVELHGLEERLCRITPCCSGCWSLPADDPVSLIPFPSASRVEASGVAWPLDGEVLQAPDRLGQSNRALGGEVEVFCGGGTLYVWFRA